ncbi:MAG: hypothetical protein ACF8OB_03300 [Phycisphaeraceae bacterium JB051]
MINLGVLMALTVAWRPFLDPMPIDRYWLLLIFPLVLAIAVVYKAVKIPQPGLAVMTVQSLKLAGQIVGVLAGAAAVLLFLTEIIGL